MKGDSGSSDSSGAYASRIDKSGVQAVERAVRLLEVVAAAEVPPTMQSLAEALGCSPSTVHRIVVTLSQGDLLQFNPVAKRYSLGSGISRLAQARAAQLDLVTIAQPSMDRLRTDTGETVSLWVRSGETTVCLAVADSFHEVRQTVPVGGRARFELSSGSRVLLAEKDPEEVRAWVRSVTGGPDAETEAEVLEDMEDLRNRGVVVLAGEESSRHHPDVATVAAPIFDEAGRIAAALVTAGPVMRFNSSRIEKAVPLTRSRAHDITIALGGRPPASQP